MSNGGKGDDVTGLTRRTLPVCGQNPAEFHFSGNLHEFATEQKILQTEKLLLFKEGSCGWSGECQCIFSFHSFSGFHLFLCSPAGQGNTRK